VSKTLQGTKLNNTEVISSNLAEQITEIKKLPGSEILLFGSPSTTHSLMKLGLIDGYWLFVNPIVLGQGIPLFVDVKEQIKLQLQSTHRFASGVTELSYFVEGK
jgi:dihydrofolate reductase